jgi:hypothetical protein
MNSIYNKLTFNQWLRRFKNFDSMKHFNRYIESIAINDGEREVAKLYYKKQYETWYADNFGGVQNAY